MKKMKTIAETASEQAKIHEASIDSALNIRDAISKLSLSKTEIDILCLFDMSIFKSISIINTIKDLEYKNQKTNKTDPFSTVHVLRGQFEAFCNFNNLLIQNSSQEELELKYMVWKMYGLNNRQKYPKPESEEFQKKQEQEKKEIDALKTAIKNNACFKRLTSTKKDSICNPKTDWKLTIDNQSFEFVPYSKLFEFSGVEMGNKFHTQYYRYLSSNAHPSYLSIMQFSEVMKTEKSKDDMMVHLLHMSDAFLSFFIVDLCKYSEDINSCFDKLPKENKQHIWLLSKLYRPSIKIDYE